MFNLAYFFLIVLSLVTKKGEIEDAPKSPLWVLVIIDKRLKVFNMFASVEQEIKYATLHMKVDSPSLFEAKIGSKTRGN